MAGETSSKIGRYEVVGKLTTGGMAEIFLGRLTGPRGFEKPVVIKRILGHLTSPTFSEMFLDEARIVAEIRHPNVVQVFDFGEEGGQLFMAMEYLEGESLGGILRRLWATGKSLDPAAAALIAAGACAGLHAAHELKDRQGRPLGLVHRDVSPSNLFVTYDGHVKLIDFGVAKAQGGEQRTAVGQVRGKSAYMSPEQALAHLIDRRSDIFSLGIVLFEMCTMRRLFQRENPLLVYRAICEEPIPAMRDARNGVPPELDRIGRRALERARDARYATAQEMRYELLAAARKLTSIEPEEVIASTMRELFADRIAQKHALRLGLLQGERLEELPEAETDLGATIPSLALADGVLDAAERRPRRSRLIAVTASGAIVIAGLGVAWTRAIEREPFVPPAPLAIGVAEPPTGAPPEPSPSRAARPAFSSNPGPGVVSKPPSRAASRAVANQKRPTRSESPPAKGSESPPPRPVEQGAGFRRFD
jgi:serine/threonine-protein kinase